MRNGDDNRCQDDRVVAVKNCSAYQAVRAMTIIGTIFLVLGASILVVSVCVTTTKLTTTGAILTLLASLFLMIAFAVFYASIFNTNNLPEQAAIRWSFILLIVSWPLALIASLLGLASGPGKAESPAEFDESE